jgi:CubicO group peptidase (beta-lactamase class C family)
VPERDTEPTIPLIPLPAQPDGVPWPAERWPQGAPADAPGLEALLTEAFDPGHPIGETQAVLIVHRGRLVYQRYAGQLVFFDRPPEPIGPDTALLSWSMAKSMLHAVVGMLVGDGRLRTGDPAALPWWDAADADPRGAVTVQQMLEMRDGLDFNEAYTEDDGHSDVIDMLFGAGAQDVAAYAAQRELAAKPGERFSYSSGTTNLVSAVVARELGSEEAYRGFLAERLFGALGMRSAQPGFDAAGTWVASSFVHATAADFARFGYLYLRDGVWDGVRLLPEGWVDHGRRARSQGEDGRLYGAHWWIMDDAWGTFWCSGYEGQSITVTPGLDLVVVRLGKTPQERSPELAAWREAVIACFAEAAGEA